METDKQKTKVCNKCGLEKHTSSFYKQSSKRDGLNPRCRDCLKEYKKQLALQNKNSNIKEKKCSKCGIIKPLDSFHAQAIGKGGKSAQCKDCTRAYDASRALKNVECNVKELTCSSCLEIKSVENFHRNIHHKYGRDNMCKGCRNKLYREWWWKNREKELARSRRVYYANREKRCAHYRRTWWENREAQLERSKKYRVAHTKERREYSKRWRKNNPKLARQMAKNWRESNKEKTRYYCAKYRAFKRSATPPWLTDGQMMEVYNMYILAKNLETDTGKKYEVDHIIPLNGGNFCGLNVPWNLRVIEANENRSKGNKLVPELGLTAP